MSDDLIIFGTWGLSAAVIFVVLLVDESKEAAQRGDGLRPVEIGTAAFHAVTFGSLVAAGLIGLGLGAAALLELLTE